MVPFIQIVVTETPQSTYHFLTSCCALIGGAITVRSKIAFRNLLATHSLSLLYFMTCQIASVFDRTVDSLQSHFKKLRMGKLT
jgi:hypothetical protein